MPCWPALPTGSCWIHTSICASLGVNRFIAAQLFGVTLRDPAAIIATLLVLGCVTLIAGYVPARHASRIDPVKALKAE